ncbi:MAG TPA: sigma-70 family RNA polymerase sigma factor [Acidimicrobiales bacterium]|nr:sigma-70 family RNA polymerase sigma factor [Acidimicrobiales bacterium]
MTAEPGGFTEWYLAAHRRVLAALIAYGGDYEEASDATDEAFARAFARWERVSVMASPEGWAFVVARNALRRSVRRRSRERSVAVTSAATEAARDASSPGLAAIELAGVLAVLSERQREVVVLHHGLDLAQETVASLLGISRSTVATTLLDARVALGVTTKGGARA